VIKPKALTSISFVFPCFNEELNIGAVIEQAIRTIEPYGVDYEVLIVDDGSRDRSAQIVSGWTAKNSKVSLIQHPRNLGYGAALRSGLASASKDLVFLADGDNQFHLSEIEKLFSKIDSCDVVSGYRLNRRDKPLRRLNGWLWTRLNRFLFGLKVRDVDCAFKLFRRRALEGIDLKSDQLLIHAEILARLKKKGCRVEEIGVTHYPRTAGKATATAAGRVLKTFKELFWLYWTIR
jgi:glycosyltransferase involved in cell wall biosynthesis